MYRNCKKKKPPPQEPAERSSYRCCWKIKSQVLEGTGQFALIGGARGGAVRGEKTSLLREVLSFSNILDDLFQLLFRVHVELHAGLHSGKLEEKERGVK